MFEKGGSSLKERANDIRRRHEERKKQRRQAGGRKTTSYQKMGEREEAVPVFQQHSQGYPSPDNDNFQGGSRKQGMFFRLMIAAILFLAVGVMYKSSAPMLDGARVFVQDTFENEFQFARIGDWYENQFGEPLALLPREKNDNATNKDEKENPHFAQPVSGTTVEKDFSKTKKGILLQTSKDKEIKSVEEGRVVFIGNKSGLGKVVKVQHADGTESWYGKLAKVDIKLYDYVKQGEKIGKVASSDDEQTGMFYFALKKGDAFINPIKVISFD